MGNSIGWWDASDDNGHTESEVNPTAQKKGVSEGMQRRPRPPVLAISHEDQGTLSPKKKPQKKGRAKNSRRQHRKNWWDPLEYDPL